MDGFGRPYKAKSVTGEADPFALVSRINKSAWERMLAVWRTPDWTKLSNQELESLSWEYRYMVGQKGHILANRPRQFTFMREVCNVFCVSSDDYWIGLGGSKISGGHATEFKILTDEIYEAGVEEEVHTLKRGIDTYHTYENGRIVGAWIERAGFVFARSGTRMIIRNAFELCLAVLAIGISIEIQQSA